MTSIGFLFIRESCPIRNQRIGRFQAIGLRVFRVYLHIECFRGLRISGRLQINWSGLSECGGVSGF